MFVKIADKGEINLKVGHALVFTDHSIVQPSTVLNTFLSFWSTLVLC